MRLKLGYYVNPMGHSGLVEIPRDLSGYYRILDCTTIDIVSRKIGDKYYDIVCDDEGLFKENVMVSAMDGKGNPMLVGRLLICNHNKKGEASGLTKKDIENIEAHVVNGALLRGDR